MNSILPFDELNRLTVDVQERFSEGRVTVEDEDDIIDMLPGLQRNHLGVGLILPSTNVAAATESGHTFASLILQQDMKPSIRHLFLITRLKR